jgi:exonuclease SbcD
LKRLTNNGKRPVVAIAGNHDSPDRIDSPNPLARECGILFVGNPDVTIPTAIIENGFEITSQKTVLEFNFPNMNFLFELSRHLMLMSRD